MAISAFQKVLNRLFKEFSLRMGREPQTPKEWMDLQNEAVQFFNRTKGVPPGPAKPPFQGWTPKVIPGGKKEGIESLLETGEVTLGTAPKTTAKTLADKKDRHILFRDAEEDIARIKRENKQAIEDFKKKHGKKTVEDFRDEGDFDPGGMASGGRIAMAGGGALFKFIEKLFIKASNDIRQGKGKFKGLDQKQRMVQHDNLTKKVMEFQKTKKLPEGTEQYFDVNPNEAFAAAQAKVKKTDPLVSDDVLAKAYDEVFYQKPASGDYKYDADVLADSIAEQLGKGSLDDFSQAQQFEIHDTALNRIRQDLQIKRAKKIAEKNISDIEQKIELQMFDPKDRKPNAEGGITRAGFPFGGRALKGIMDAWRANKTWGVGGPPYKPEATTFNVKELTKKLYGTELSLADLKGMSDHPSMVGIDKFKFEKFNKDWKNLKASVLKEKLNEAKIQGEGMIEAAKQVPADNPTAKKIQAQFLREGKKQVEEATEGLREMDNYMGMLQKPRRLHASGGLAYMLGEPNTRTEALQEFGVVTDPWGMYTDPSLYAKGERGSGVPGRAEYKEGGVGQGPWTMGQGAPTPNQEQNLETPQPQVMGTPDPLKMPQGIPSAAPKSMDPRHMQQQMMRQAMMGQQQNMGQQRMGYGKGGMTRRAFMKLFSGLAALPFIGKGVSKVAPKAITETAEVIARTPDGIPKYVYDLIEVVKAKGTKDFIEGYKRSDYGTKHTYKGVEVIEEAGGTTRIRKQKEGGGQYRTDEGDVDSFDGISHEIEMEIKPQYDEIMDESGATFYKDPDGKKVYEQKIPDEYAEYTARPDMDGKMKDVDEYIDDLDHLELKEIAEEDIGWKEGFKPSKQGKASGGLAHMLGE